MTRFFTFLLCLFFVGQMNAQINANPSAVEYGAGLTNDVEFTFTVPNNTDDYKLFILANGGVLASVETTDGSLTVTATDLGEGFFFYTATVTLSFGVTGSGADVIADAHTTFSTVALNVTTGTQFANGSLNGALPISLSSFKAKAQNKSVAVTWTTSEEINNDFFTLERSFDNKNFDVVTEMAGAGNSSEELTYNFSDDNVNRVASSNTSYYRLMQTDFDGQFTYSEVISVALDSRPSLEITNVTAINNTLDVNFTATEGQTFINVYSLNGQVIATDQVDANEGFNMASISLNNAQNGIYVVRINDGTQQVVRKFMK